MSDDGSGDDDRKRSHKGRWFLLFALAIAAAAFGRQMAIGSSDKKFEERLRQLDDNRD